MFPSNLSSKVLAARWIVPVETPPLEHGWIEIVGDRIVDLGKGKPPGKPIDCGDIAILPRLVNAHTHLEFSDLTEPIGDPGIAFESWIGQVIARRAQADRPPTAQAIEQGLIESAGGAVGLIADIATTPCRYPDWQDFPQLVSLGEVLGLHAGRARERLQAFQLHHEAHPSTGISPHAPYSTSMETITECVRRAKHGDFPLAMHVAESKPERELLVSQQGTLAEMLRQWKLFHEDCFPPRKEPFLELIDRLSAAPLVLLVHGNDLRDHEIERVAKYDHISVVMCPRTHHYFGFERHPVDRMLGAGVRVALGTDSRASNPDLQLWKEVQFLLQHRSDLDPAKVIEMATMAGADALARPGLGRLAIGCSPGLAMVQTSANDTHQLYRDFATHDLKPF